MELVKMSKINNRVELYFKDEIEPVVIRLNDDILIEKCTLREDGGYIISLKNGEIITIDPLYKDIIYNYQEVYYD